MVLVSGISAFCLLLFNMANRKDENKRTNEEMEPSTPTKTTKKLNVGDSVTEKDNNFTELLMEIRSLRTVMERTEERVQRMEEKMERRMTAVEEEVADIKNNMGKVNDELTAVVKEVKGVSHECGKVGKDCEGVKARLSKIEEEINKQDRLARKNNLRLSGVEEKGGEDVKKEVERILREHFKGENVQVDECYRVGRRREQNGESGGKGRTIIMKMNSFQDKLTILQKKKQALDKTDMFIREDLTPGDLMLLKQLQPVIKEVKERGDRWFFRDGKLYVNGKVHH